MLTQCEADLLLHVVEPVSATVAVHEAKHALHLHSGEVARVHQLDQLVQALLQLFYSSPPQTLQLSEVKRGALRSKHYLEVAH